MEHGGFRVGYAHGAFN